MPPRTRRATTDRPPTRRTTSSPRSPSQRGRASHPRLASPPTAEERVRRTNEYRASRSRARAYRDGLRAAAAAAPAPAPAPAERKVQEMAAQRLEAKRKVMYPPSNYKKKN